MIFGVTDPMRVKNGLYSASLAAAALCLISADAYASCTLDADVSAMPSGWRLAWSDEFNADELDASKWNRETDCWGGGNDERQCYTDSPRNSRLEDGCLVIEAHLEESTGPAWPARLHEGLTEEQRAEIRTQPVTSARLNTQGKADWRYGRIEVRARLPEGQGSWPAFWMLPSDEYYGGWALSGEIDILETVNLGEPCPTCPGGNENHVLGTLHFGGAWPHNTYRNREAYLPVTERGNQQFHVFAAEWTEGRVEWFLDGESYGFLTEADWHSDSERADGRPFAPFDQEFYLILNLAIGGHLAESRNLGGVDYEALPRSILIDWVRVFDCPADIETAISCRSSAETGQ